MKSIKGVALSILLLSGILFSAVYLSCTKDNCKTINCFNGGTCGGGVCSCPLGWGGDFCQTSVLSGNWGGQDACDSGKNYTLSIEIDPYATDTTKFIVKTPHGYPTQVQGIRNGATTINISQQICDTVLLSGTINLASINSMTFTYTITDTNAKAHVTQCSGSYTRQ